MAAEARQPIRLWERLTGRHALPTSLVADALAVNQWGLHEAALEEMTAPTARSLSLDWESSEALGITGESRRSGTLNDRERKETLCDIYLNNTWVSACIDAICLRMTSGTFAIEEVYTGEGNDANKQLINDMLLYVNDDDDFLQFIDGVARDLGIYGEAYAEILFEGNGKTPRGIVKIDCQSMSYVLDKTGQILKYVQSLANSTDTVDFTPEQIIRWHRPHPKAAKRALSPIEKVQNPADADINMADWWRSFFKKGAKPSFTFDMPPGQGIDQAQRFIKYLKDNYTGKQNAHVPLVLPDGVKTNPMGAGAVDVDFIKGRTFSREEILAAFKVPPAVLGVIETGSIGGGTGESQDKSFINNGVNPDMRRIMEKFNYRIVQQGFGITDWKVTLHYAEYRDDMTLAKLQESRIKNGIATPNEERESMGRQPYKGYGDTPMIVITREITPLDRLEDLSDEQKAAADVTQATAQEKLRTLQLQNEALKNPPPPPPVVQVHPDGSPATPPVSGAAPVAPHTQPAPGTGQASPQPSGKPAAQPQESHHPKGDRAGHLAPARFAHLHTSLDPHRDQLIHQVHAFFATLADRGHRSTPREAAANPQEEELLAALYAAFALTLPERTRLAALIAAGISNAALVTYLQGVEAAQGTPLTDTQIQQRIAAQVQQSANAHAASIADTYNRDVETAAQDALDGWKQANPDSTPHQATLQAALFTALTQRNAWKSVEIGKTETSTGAQLGSMQVKDDLGNGLVDFGDGMSKNDLVQIVLPEDSSLDECADYVEQEFELDESLPDFPLHPHCPHNVWLVPRGIYS